MLKFIRKNIFIILIFIITLFLGFLTFLTFIDKSFIELTDENLQYLLVSNILLLLVFFSMIFIEIKNSIKNEIAIEGSRANRKYITFFSLFTLIPSILISVFSLFLFSFALEKYFDKKITTAVSNSYQLAINYVSTVRNKVESDIVLAAFDLNKNVSIMNDGDDLFIAKKAIHRMQASPDGVTFIEVQRGKCDEDDIVRLQDDYGRVDK